MKKKIGKYEKVPAAAPAKQPKVKNLLLQTYFTSLLCLVLCVAMFMGTSYAWFTSEVTNTANEIYVGTLKVGLYKIEDEKQVNLASTNTDAKLFDGDIRWEPGYTTLETIQIVNEGDLAFKYVLNFTEGTGASTNAKSLTEVAECFEVWVYDYYANEKVAPKATSYADITADGTENGTKWEYAGSLNELLAGKIVLDGNMVTVRKDDVATASETEATQPSAGPNDSVATEDTYTIALHMKENAGTDVMGHKISLNVKLVAYQMGSEQDSLNNKNYDQMVATEAQLREALANGGTIALAADIELTEGLTVAADKTVILDLNGHKITGTASVNMTSLITNKGTLVVAGGGEIAINHDGTDVGDGAVNAINNRGILTINGGKIINTGSGSQIGYGVDNYNGAALTVNGGEITVNGSNYYDGIRLFCGSNETTVTVNGGKISSIWAQNPTANKATEVKGTVIINGGEITKTYYENYTTVKVKTGITAVVEAYGNGKESTTTTDADGYTVYSFVH